MGQVITTIWKWLRGDATASEGGGSKETRSSSCDNQSSHYYINNVTPHNNIHGRQYNVGRNTLTQTLQQQQQQQQPSFKSAQKPIRATSSSSSCDFVQNDHNASVTQCPIQQYGATNNSYQYSVGYEYVDICIDANTLLGGTRRIGAYSSSQRILLVGEGDFSFSTSLAKAFGSAHNMIATSLDSFEFLKNNYRMSTSNISELSSRGCRVLHGVNATEAASNSMVNCIKYDRVIFNFPHAGFPGKHVPRETQIAVNQKLVGLFLANAKRMIEGDGEIHITHKCYGFFRQWNLRVLGLSQGLYLIEEADFERSNYPGYHTKYGFGGDKDFDCSNSKTYKFRLKSTIA